jgi:pimeloyl-ACP methyl ester carboxylesterase
VRRHLGTVQVIAPNRPGYDGTPAGGFRRGADRVRALLDQRGVDRAVLVGYSWAGGVALTTALSYPDRVAGLALLASVGTMSSAGVVDRLLARAGRRISRVTKSAFWLEQQSLVSELPLLSRRLEEIAAPTVVLAGRRDRVVPPRAARELAARLPTAELRVVTAGHRLLHQAPEAVADAVLAAVRRSNGT